MELILEVQAPLVGNHCYKGKYHNAHKHSTGLGLCSVCLCRDNGSWGGWEVSGAIPSLAKAEQQRTYRWLYSHYTLYYHHHHTLQYYALIVSDSDCQLVQYFRYMHVHIVRKLCRDALQLYRRLFHVNMLFQSCPKLNIHNIRNKSLMCSWLAEGNAQSLVSLV